MNTKKINELPILEQTTEETNVLVEQNGKASRIPVAKIGGAQQAVITGNGAPTEFTEGAVGSLYFDTVSYNLYKCIRIITETSFGTVYIWREHFAGIKAAIATEAASYMTGGAEPPEGSYLLLTTEPDSNAFISEGAAKGSLVQCVGGMWQEVMKLGGGSSSIVPITADELDTLYGEGKLATGTLYVDTTDADLVHFGTESKQHRVGYCWLATGAKAVEFKGDIGGSRFMTAQEAAIASVVTYTKPGDLVLVTAVNGMSGQSLAVGDILKVKDEFCMDFDKVGNISGFAPAQ